MRFLPILLLAFAAHGACVLNIRGVLAPKTINGVANRGCTAYQGVSGFTPATLGAGLKIWVSPVKETKYSNGNAVDTAHDWSGNGNYFSQAVGAAQPTWDVNDLNGYPAFVFDGVADFLAGAASTLSVAQNVGRVYIFLVSKSVVTFARPFVITTAVTSTRASNEWGDGYSQYAVGRRLDANSAQEMKDTLSAATVYCNTNIFDYTNAQLIFYHNATAGKVKDPFQTAGSTSNTASTNVQIGSGVGGLFYGGPVGDAVVYVGTLTATQLEITQRFEMVTYAIAPYN